MPTYVNKRIHTYTSYIRIYVITFRYKYTGEYISACVLTSASLSLALSSSLVNSVFIRSLLMDTSLISWNPFSAHACVGNREKVCMRGAQCCFLFFSVFVFLGYLAVFHTHIKTNIHTCVHDQMLNPESILPYQTSKERSS